MKELLPRSMDKAKNGDWKTQVMPQASVSTNKEKRCSYQVVWPHARLCVMVCVCVCRCLCVVILWAAECEMR